MKINPNDLLIIIERGEEIKDIMKKYNVEGGLDDGFRWASILYNEFIDEVRTEDCYDSEAGETLYKLPPV